MGHLKQNEILHPKTEVIATINYLDLENLIK